MDVKASFIRHKTMNRRFFKQLFFSPIPGPMENLLESLLIYPIQDVGNPFWQVYSSHANQIKIHKFTTQILF